MNFVVCCFEQPRQLEFILAKTLFQHFSKYKLFTTFFFRNKHNYKLINADATLPLDGSRVTTQEFYFSDQQAYFFEKDLPQQI